MAIFRRCYLRQRLRRCYRSLQRPVKRERTKKRKETVCAGNPGRIFSIRRLSGNPGWTVFHLPSTPEGCRPRLASGCQLPPPTRPTSSAQPRNPGLRLELPKPSVTCARRFAGRCKDAAGPAGRSRRRGRQGRQIARSTTDRLRDDTPASRISRCQRPRWRSSVLGIAVHDAMGWGVWPSKSF